MAARVEDATMNKEIWGTWEELLLVSAVNRHGTKNWDSVTMEIQNRITSSPHFILTPHNCKQKYQDLRRRFKAIDEDFKKNEPGTDTSDTIPWLEELRKLRVAELRREVQQYDVSIVSLQLKVKRLREERERSSNGEVKPDLERVRPETEDKEKSGPAAEKPISGEDSDRENQSFNESNSTDPKGKNRVIDESDKKIEPNDVSAGELDPVNSGGKKPAAAGEGSCNGSSETIAKDSVDQAFEKSSEPIPTRESSESPELWESVAESKGAGVEGTKESSDLQSSASLSKEPRRKEDVSVSSSGEEPETDEISPAIRRISIKSHPLAKFLEIIKSHKYGYVFERRLESQETLKYKSLIRQHMDLETLHKRLKEGQYANSSPKFYRDLLLLMNNAIVFFPNNSVEFNAAIELRQLISLEMSSRIQKPTQSPEVQPPLQPPPPPPPPPPKIEPEPEPSHSLLLKPKPSIPMIACRKRSSISSKGEKKVEKKEATDEERKPQDHRAASLVEEQIVIKKGKRDRPASGARSARTVGKNLFPNRNPSPSSSSKGGILAEENSDEAEKEKEKEKEKKNNVNTVAKKRSVANFLDRMKKNSPSNGNLLESLKSSENNSNNAERKKGGGGRGDGRKEQGARQNSSRKQLNSPAKRSVGRPPKRNASSPITPSVLSKRSREANETEIAASRPPQKRSRR